VAVSVDGFGDFSSAAWGQGQATSLAVSGRVLFPHSLGVFYQALTQYLGFPNYGDEYKVMGLAPYGKPHYLEQMREIVKLQGDGSFALNLKFFRHHNEKVAYEWSGGEPSVGNLFQASPLEDLLQFPPRKREDELGQHHKDLAHSVQAMYEEAFFHLLATCHDQFGGENLTLAGGCAMNSVANGKVYHRSPFKNVYVQAAAGDAGGAIGAAMVVWNQLSGERPQAVEHAYLGPQFSDETIAALLQEHKNTLLKQNCVVRQVSDEQELCALTAAQIAAGKVVGWFQGRMEWGPRALGNRSILGDPRRADMKDILNLKIKRRESFRPFAPSILREAVADWFELEDDVPFMMQVFPIREERRAQIPAVTHVDGSGRLQTVHA
jgi:carbamoyltransferase